MFLALKLISVPGMLGAASLAARRWGPLVAGWLAALPLTSGLVMGFLVIEQGPQFAITASRGSLIGLVPLCTFYLSYAWMARRYSWRASLLVGLSVCVSCTALFQEISPGTLVSLLSGLAAITATYWLIPPHTEALPTPKGSVMWEVPFRMAVALVVVLFITGAADRLGPHLAGLLTAFPVTSGVLAPFTHREQGPGGAIHVLRGITIGLTSFATFFASVAFLLPRVSFALTFACAAVATAAVHTLILHTAIARQRA